MVSRQLAPRLRLLGLLLISASVIMGLVVSAVGVTSVNLSSPFAKKIVTEVRDAKSNMAVQNGNYSDLNRMDDRYVTTPTGSFGLLDYGVLNNPPNSVLGLDPINIPGTQVQAVAPELNEDEENTPFQIPLWALIAPISILGILLWMTPMPAPANSRRARTR